MIDPEDEPKTTTILTIDLPPDMGFRLRRAMRRHNHRSPKEITLEALKSWLEQDEAASAS